MREGWREARCAVGALAHAAGCGGVHSPPSPTFLHAVAVEAHGARLSLRYVAHLSP